MDRLRQLFAPSNEDKSSTLYKPLDNGQNEGVVDEEGHALIGDRHATLRSSGEEARDEEDDVIDGMGDVSGDAPVASFSWTYYAVFLLLGVAMLWAWNMFLAAGPYFQSRLRGDKWLLSNFQSAELTVSTAVNLGAMILLANMQKGASYPGRIIKALLINIVVFTLLAISTRAFLSRSAMSYFVFMMITVLVSSFATGLMQNGIFAYMAGFGREEYAQGTMTGQAIAGVLPCIVQIVSVLSSPPVDATKQTPKESSRSALAFFATATAVSLVTLLAFLYLLSLDRKSAAYQAAAQTEHGSSMKTSIPLSMIYRKTFFLSTSVFLTFAIAMFYPVFTQQIQSVRSPTNLPRLFEPASFIPLAMLIWNLGDLGGRLLSAIPSLNIVHRPHLIMTIAVGRVLLIPLYLLCNTRGHGAVINSDSFYFLVQIMYGVTNGFIGTMCMMGAVDYVEVHEREATGAFMTLMLVAGLTVGSLLSFIVA